MNSYERYREIYIFFLSFFIKGIDKLFLTIYNSYCRKTYASLY